MATKSAAEDKIPSQNILRAQLDLLHTFNIVTIGSFSSKELEILLMRYALLRTQFVLWAKSLNYGQLGVEESARVVEMLRGLGNLINQSCLAETSGLSWVRQNDQTRSRSRFTMQSRGLQMFKPFHQAYIRELHAIQPISRQNSNSKYCVVDINGFRHFLDKVERYLEAIISSKGLADSFSRSRWRVLFFQCMSTISEDTDSLTLLVEVGHRACDVRFAEAAHHRLVEREGRPGFSFMRRFRLLHDDSDRIVFDRLHQCFHKLFPGCAQPSERSSPPRILAPMKASSEKEQVDRKPKYLGICYQMASRRSSLFELEVQSSTSDSELFGFLKSQSAANGSGCKFLRTFTKIADVQMIQVCIAVPHIEISIPFA